MSTDRERRQAELESLQAMARASQGHMEVTASPDLSQFTIHLRNIPAPVGTTSSSFQIADRHELLIVLPAMYPDEMPRLSFDRPVFHPNCFTSGVYCHGDKWYPARRLDDLVAEMVRNIQVQGDLAFNSRSPANLDAARFYANSGKLADLRRRLNPVVIAPVRPYVSASAPRTTNARVRIVGRSAQPAVSIRRV